MQERCRDAVRLTLFVRDSQILQFTSKALRSETSIFLVYVVPSSLNSPSAWVLHIASRKLKIH